MSSLSLTLRKATMVEIYPYIHNACTYTHIYLCETENERANITIFYKDEKNLAKFKNYHYYQILLLKYSFQLMIFVPH